MTPKEYATMYGVSGATARRWVASGDPERYAAKHEEREWLREECARNGTTRYARYSRTRDGLPLDVVAGPMKRVRS